MKKFIAIFLAATLLITLLFVTCSMAEAKLPVAYMWQETELDGSIFELTQDEDDVHLFTAKVHPYEYKDTIRIEVSKVEDFNLETEEIDGFWETTLTSPIMVQNIENEFPIVLDPIDGLYKIQFESVSLTEEGEVDENKMIYIVCRIEIDGSTMEILSVDTWTIDDPEDEVFDF